MLADPQAYAYCPFTATARTLSGMLRPATLERGLCAPSCEEAALTGKVNLLLASPASLASGNDPVVLSIAGLAALTGKVILLLASPEILNTTGSLPLGRLAGS